MPEKIEIVGGFVKIAGPYYRNREDYRALVEAKALFVRLGTRHRVTKENSAYWLWRDANGFKIGERVLSTKPKAWMPGPINMQVERGKERRRAKA